MAAHVWQAFAALSETRQNTGTGPSPISRAEIRLWEEDESQSLEPWERRSILALDKAWLKSIHPKS